MNINHALGLWRDGKLRNLDLHGLRTMSAECVVFIQNHIPEAVLLQTAIDDEIRRKEARESSDKLLQQTENLTEQINKLTGQVVELVRIAAEQQRLAAKLDGQTDTLISLTKWLRGLTIALVILALPLFFEALHFLEIRKNTVQGSPHVEQSAHDTQQNTNR